MALYDTEQKTLMIFDQSRFTNSNSHEARGSCANYDNLEAKIDRLLRSVEALSSMVEQLRSQNSISAARARGRAKAPSGSGTGIKTEDVAIPAAIEIASIREMIWIFGQVDTDNSNTLSRFEFESFMRKRPDMQTKKGNSNLDLGAEDNIAAFADEFLSLTDANSDGVTSICEWLKSFDDNESGTRGGLTMAGVFALSKACSIPSRPTPALALAPTDVTSSTGEQIPVIVTSQKYFDKLDKLAMQCDV